MASLSAWSWICGWIAISSLSFLDGVRAAEPAAAGNQAANPASSNANVNFPEFKKELLKHIQNQRTEWKAEKQVPLADFIAIELQTKMDEKLTPVLCSNICEYLEFNLERIDPSSDTVTEEMVHQFYRWAIADLAIRKPMTNSEIQLLEKDITECFSKFAEQMKKDVPPNLQADLVKSAGTNLKWALMTVHDPLWPGLKRLPTKGDFSKFTENNLKVWQEQKVAFGELGAPAGNATGPNDDEIKALVEVCARTLRAEMDTFDVQYDNPLKESVQKYSEVSNERFKKQREQSKKKMEEEIKKIEEQLLEQEAN